MEGHPSKNRRLRGLKLGRFHLKRTFAGSRPSVVSRSDVELRMAAALAEARRTRTRIEARIDRVLDSNRSHLRP